MVGDAEWGLMLWDGRSKGTLTNINPAEGQLTLWR
jgi:hypothetical protein